MPLKLFANQFSTDLILATCQASLGPAFAFSFNATYIRVENLSAVPIHVNFNSTGAPSTGDPELRPGKDFTIAGVHIYGGSIGTTSTTTSTEDGVSHRVTVSAFGP